MSESNTPTPTPVPTPTPTPTATPTAPWYEGKVSPEHVGVWQAKSFDITDPAKLVTQLTDSYRNVEKLIGQPADKILRVPEPTDEAGQKAFWARFGAQSDPKGYDFNTIKRGDGSDVDANLVAAIQEAAAKNNLPVEGVQALVRELVKVQDGQAAAALVADNEKRVASDAALRASWGANWEANQFVAKQAATALGIDKDTVETLQGQIGYEKVMEMFRQIGVRIGEDKYVASGAGGNKSGVMTMQEAVAKKADMMGDPVWVKKYLAGGSQEAKEMTALNTLIASASVRGQ